MPTKPILLDSTGQSILTAAQGITAALEDVAGLQLASKTAQVAPDFSASAAYAAGDYVFHEGTLYRFTADHAAGAWAAADAEAVTVGGELAQSDVETHCVKNAIGFDNLIPIVQKNRVNRTSNGVTFTYNLNNNSVSVSGTATSDAYYTILSTNDEKPAFLVAGKAFLLDVDAPSGVYFQMLKEENGAWTYTRYRGACISIPSGSYGFRLYVPRGNTVSGTVRIYLRELESRNDILRYIGGYPYESKTSNGVSYSYDASTDQFSVEGTSTNISSYVFLLTTDDVPPILKIGESYYLKFSTSDSNVKFQMMAHINGIWKYYNYFGDTVITIPSTADDVGFRLAISNGKTVNGEVSVAMYDVMSVGETVNYIKQESLYDAGANAFELYTTFEENSGWWDAEGHKDSVFSHKHTQKLQIRPLTTYYTGFIIPDYACYGAFFDKNGDYLAPLTSGMITQHNYLLPDATEESSTKDYEVMYKFTSPANACYLSFNFSVLVQYNYRNYISSKPVFATSIYGDLVIKKNDAAYSRWSGRKLCVIGTSQVMIDRLKRTGKFSGPDAADESQYVCGFQEYLVPYWDTVDSYGYSNAAMFYVEGETTKSIYTRVVTDQLDISGYDDYIICHSSSGLTTMDEVGTLSGMSDLGDNTTFIGALRQIIDYIYTLNPKANVIVQTRLTRAALGSSSIYPIVQASNQAVRDLAAMLGLTVVDDAKDSGFNYYNAPYWCYDALGHPNQVGSYYVGTHMRKTIVGV